jgi:membrane associated rhomboid family serine protease
VKSPSEPILNVPTVVAATIAVLILVHAVRELLLTPDQDLEVLLLFAFIPARYTEALPGGWGADVWTFVTHAFLHGSWLHLGVNIAWLLPFGSALARRFGTVRFLVLFAVTAAAGAATQLAAHWGQEEVMVGASGAISGVMAAAIRFAFQRNGPLHLWAERDDESYRIAAPPLAYTFRDTRVLAFVGVWFIFNVAMGLGIVEMPGVEGPIAWEAHVGGFLAGLLLFPLLDPVVIRANGGMPPDQSITED